MPPIAKRQKCPGCSSVPAYRQLVLFWYWFQHSKHHPNIITIHEIGQRDDLHFIITEFIDGQSLRQHTKGARLPLPEAINIALQIASALSAAHLAGIVHRVIKPENIMVRRDGYVKVLDFGLAKLAERRGDGTTGRRSRYLARRVALSPCRRTSHNTRHCNGNFVLHVA